MTDRIKLEVGTSKLDLELNEINLNIAITVLEAEKHKAGFKESVNQAFNLPKNFPGDKLAKNLLEAKEKKKTQKTPPKEKATHKGYTKQIKNYIETHDKFDANQISKELNIPTVSVSRLLCALKNKGHLKQFYTERKTNSRLISYIRNKLPSKRYQCPECHEQFRFFESMQVHAKEEHGSTILDEDKEEYLI